MMSKVTITDGNGSWYFKAQGYALDIGVDPRSGYHVYERTDDACVPVAHKVRHLLGKQVVWSPRGPNQISEQQLLQAIEEVV
jgi:hypothetical protein